MKSETRKVSYSVLTQNINPKSAKQKLLQTTFEFFIYCYLFFRENKSLFSEKIKVKLFSTAVVIGALRVNRCQIF